MGREIGKDAIATWYKPAINPPVPVEWGLDEETIETLEEFLWALLITGESDTADYSEVILETLEDIGAPEVAEKDTADYAKALITARRTLARKLGVTEADGNLVRAFAELATEGIVARGNFSCCGTCGHHEIWGECDNTRTWRGYIFYHQQDAEKIGEGGTYIDFGVFPQAYMSQEQWDKLTEPEQDTTYEKLSVEIMRETVIPILTRHGITVGWNGSYTVRPYLGNIEVFEIP